MATVDARDAAALKRACVWLPFAAVLTGAMGALGLLVCDDCGHSRGAGELGARASVRYVARRCSSSSAASTRRWLKETERVRGIIEERYAHLEGAARTTAAAQENVLVQLENLRALPLLSDRLATGRLRLSGWCSRSKRGRCSPTPRETERFGKLPSA